MAVKKMGAAYRAATRTVPRRIVIGLPIALGINALMVWLGHRSGLSVDTNTIVCLVLGMLMGYIVAMWAMLAPSQWED